MPFFSSINVNESFLTLVVYMNFLGGRGGGRDKWAYRIFFQITVTLLTSLMVHP